VSEYVLMSGNEATAEGGIAGGCRYFFGYPITPQNKIPEYMSRNLPEVGGVYLQAESEVAAINMVYGAASTGARVMTTSSSPGISLMQEGLSYIVGAEVPCVVVNMVRGGPGLGNIGPAQSDYWLATRGAGHGDGRCLVYAPYSVQELHDWTARAFEIAERYRNPVMILADAILAQMIEPCKLQPRGQPPPLDKPWAIGGDSSERPRNIINSLYVNHDEEEAVNRRIQARYDQAARDDLYYSEYGDEDPEILVVAYGICARVCETAVERASEGGVKCRLLRPISLFPFPSEPLAQWAQLAHKALVVELSMGQFVEDVRLAIEGRCPVELLNRTGGNVVTPEDVTQKLFDMAAES